jgi:hypothetical protein
MDKTFENKLQSKLSNFEAKAPKATWDKVSHDLEHPFETKLKGKLAGISATVASGTRAAIESNLPGSLESGLKNKLGAHEAPVSAGLWSAISSQVESMPGVFEEAMQDKLANYEAAPSAAVMDAIFARLPNAKGIYWRRAASIAAAILLLFGIFFITNKYSKEKKAFAYSDLNEPNETTFITNGESSEKDEIIKNENIAAFTTQNESANINSGLNEANIFGVNGSDHTNKNELTNNGGGNNNVNGSNGISNGTNGSSKNSNTGNVFNATLAHNDKSSTNNFSKSINSKVDASLMASIDTDLPLVSSLDLEEGPFAKTIKPKTLEFAAAPKPIIETPEETNPIDFGVVSSNGAFAMRTKSHRMLAAYDESFTDFNKNLYQTGSYNSLGVDLAVGVSKKTKLLGGLQLTHARNQLQFDIHSNGSSTSFSRLVDNGTVLTNNYSPVSNQLAQKRENELEYENVELAALNNDSVVSGNGFEMSNTFFFVDIPVGLEFDLVSRHKSSISARIGAKIRMVAGANSYHVNSDRDQIIEVSSAVSQAFYQTSMVGFSGVQYQRTLGDNYELFVGPEVNVNLTDINKTGTWVSMRPFQFGVNLGIRQKLS